MGSLTTKYEFAAIFVVKQGCIDISNTNPTLFSVYYGTLAQVVTAGVVAVNAPAIEFAEIVFKSV